MAKFCSSSLDIQIIFEVFGGSFVSILFDILIKVAWWIPSLHLFQHLFHLKLELAEDLLSLLLLFIAVKVGQGIRLNLLSTFIHSLYIHEWAFWCLFDRFLESRFEVIVTHVVIDVCEMVDVFVGGIADYLLFSAHKLSECAVCSPGILRIIVRQNIDLFEPVLIWTCDMVEKCVSVEFLRIFEWFVFFRT